MEQTRREVMSSAARVLVCGGRDYADRQTLSDTLSRLRAERGISVLIAGGARGADTLAEEWAKASGVECVVYHADWHKHGRAAGPIRNKRMLDEWRPTLVVAFPGGRGTRNCVKQARASGIEVVEVPIGQ
jgi:hypothetical protein